MLSNLPNHAGIGLRHRHYGEILEIPSGPTWVEVHSENFFYGGPSVDFLLKVANRYPVSLHGVGLGLAGTGELERTHLLALKNLCETIQPQAISEHLCFNRTSKGFINDLLPPVYSYALLNHLISRVSEIQDILQRHILLENLSSYVVSTSNEMTEFEFLNTLAQKSGCGILLDINNIYVNSLNFGISALDSIKSINSELIGEYHLAGHVFDSNLQMFIDTHSTSICNEVWDLFKNTIQIHGKKPTLIEWDIETPSLVDMLSMAQLAEDILYG